MSTASSSSESSSTLGSHVQRALFAKSEIQISLNHHYRTKIYTSGSALSGTVVITARRDLRFDSFEVVLIGTARTRTDGYSGNNETSQTFLKMTMPIQESSYPVPRMLDNGGMHIIPFEFVLPSFLTLSACHHPIDTDEVRHQHLRLPPSMGMWANRNWTKDDLAPAMASVEYSVKARVWRDPTSESCRKIKVMEAIAPFQILPVSSEDPPLHICHSDKLYDTSKTKTLRRKLLSSKLGKITVSAAQPKAIVLYPDGHSARNTTATVEVRFDPAQIGNQPPKVTGIAGKLTALTYYSADAAIDFPNIGGGHQNYPTTRRGSYTTSVNLFSKAFDDKEKHIAWTERSHMLRRDSGYSSSDNVNGPSSPSDGEQQRRGRHVEQPDTPTLYYTARIQVPITLPTCKKSFIPTFHSCLTSRIYTLNLALSVAVGPTSNSTFNLTVPLQVAIELPPTERRTSADNGLPTFEEAVEGAAADEFLRPRQMSVPDARFMETSVLPGYGM